MNEEKELIKQAKVALRKSYDDNSQDHSSSFEYDEMKKQVSIFDESNMQTRNHVGLEYKTVQPEVVVMLDQPYQDLQENALNKKKNRK